LKKGIILIAFLMLFLFPTPQAWAQSNTLRVSFNTLPPWKIEKTNGLITGIDIEFLRLIAERMDLNIDFTPLPFKRGLKMLEVGDIDLMVGVLKRQDREKYAHFITPPYKTYSNKAFYVLKGNEWTIQCHEDLRNLVVGTQIGAKYYPEFDEDNAIRKFPVKDRKLNIKMLQAGRIHAYIATESVSDYHLGKRGLNKDIVKAQFAYRKNQDVHMALSMKSPLAKRLEEFNRVTEELLNDGAFERIKNEILKQSVQ